MQDIAYLIAVCLVAVDFVACQVLYGILSCMLEGEGQHVLAPHIVVAITGTH